MKKLTLLLTVLLTLSANKCSDKGAADISSMFDTKWVFSALNGSDLKLPEGAEQPWLQLAGDRLQGFGGCNQLMGDYTLEGTKLNFGNLGSTKKYCENVQSTEDAIKTALGQVDGYALNGDVLKLMGGGKEVAKLMKGMPSGE